MRNFIEIYIASKFHVTFPQNNLIPQLTCAIYRPSFVLDRACPSNFKSELYHFQKQLNCLQRLESTELRNKQCCKQVNNIAFNEHNNTHVYTSHLPRSVHLTQSPRSRRHRFQAEFSRFAAGLSRITGACATKQKRSRGAAAVCFH